MVSIFPALGESADPRDDRDASYLLVFFPDSGGPAVHTDLAASVWSHLITESHVNRLITLQTFQFTVLLPLTRTELNCQLQSSEIWKHESFGFVFFRRWNQIILLF